LPGELLTQLRWWFANGGFYQLRFYQLRFSQLPTANS